MPSIPQTKWRTAGHHPVPDHDDRGQRYEDGNDTDDLRDDPAFKLGLGRASEAGAVTRARVSSGMYRRATAHSSLVSSIYTTTGNTAIRGSAPAHLAQPSNDCGRALLGLDWRGIHKR